MPDMQLWTRSGGGCGLGRGGGWGELLRINLLTVVVLWSAVLPSLRSSLFVTCARHCRTDADCDQTTGQLCYQLYDGCKIGQCMCDPRRHIADDRGRCVRLRDENEACSTETAAELCRPGMLCRHGRCLCASGLLSPDGQYCLQPGERLLGHKCSAYDNDVCVQLGADGYTRNDVSCSPEGLCECAEGYKSDGFGCKRRNINEFGCVRSHHCTGGAICSPLGWCLCPPGYRPVASNSKCAPDGAGVNVPFGASCDEINELRYCSSGLVCHRCPADGSRSRCVRFSMANEFAYLLSGAARSTTMLRSTLSASSAAVLLVLCVAALFVSSR